MDHGPALEPSLATEPFEVKPNLTFAFEAKPSTDFTPVYLDKPALATAAMNAGDYKLYVGGGAINRAFGVRLREEQGLELDESNPKWPRNLFSNQSPTSSLHCTSRNLSETLRHPARHEECCVTYAGSHIHL